MHLQVRSRIVSSGGGSLGAMKADEEPGGISVVQPGLLLAVLERLAEDWSDNEDPERQHGPFNLVSAGGCGIETGGEFAFSVEAPEDEEEDLKEHRAAALRIQDLVSSADVVERYHDDIEHRKGSLRDFVRKISGQGKIIDSVVLGVAVCPDEGSPTQLIRVPVQVGAFDSKVALE